MSSVNVQKLDILCQYQKELLLEKAALLFCEKSRRIGITWLMALWAVIRCVEGKSNYYHSSADMTAAVEFVKDCESWAQMFNAVAKVTEATEVIDEDAIHTLVMTFQNGRRIVAGSSNPKFFRSKGGAVGFDEYDFHRDQRELFKAGHATAMFWGHPMRIWSSVAGEGTPMHQMVQQVESGKMAGRVKRITVLDAVAQGIVERIEMRKRRLDHVPAPDPGRRAAWLEELRSTVPNQETWDQEYLCIRRGDSSSLLTYDLIRPCEVANLQPASPGALDIGTGGPLYAGFDVGRKRDLSVLWVVEKVGDVRWTRTVKVFDRVNFTAQEGAINQIMMNPRVVRLCIDSTGIGLQLSERMQDHWGSHRVEAVNFTSAVKSELAMPLRRLFEDRLIRIPMDDAVREDLHSVRKVTTAAGNIRFDAAPGSTDGHADRFWALALACHGADATPPRTRVSLEEVPLGW